MFAPQRPALVIDRVRYVGDPVAMVIADSLPQAKDAAELVEVDYKPLSAVTSVADAARPDAPRVWRRTPTTSRIPMSGATKRRQKPLLRTPTMSSSAATSSAAFTPSTWSRAARSGPMTPERTASRSTPM